MRLEQIKKDIDRRNKIFAMRIILTAISFLILAAILIGFVAYERYGIIGILGVGVVAGLVGLLFYFIHIFPSWYVNRNEKEVG